MTIFNGQYNVLLEFHGSIVINLFRACMPSQNFTSRLSTELQDNYIW